MNRFRSLLCLIALSLGLACVDLTPPWQSVSGGTGGSPVGPSSTGGSGVPSDGTGGSSGTGGIADDAGSSASDAVVTGDDSSAGGAGGAVSSAGTGGSDGTGGNLGAGGADGTGGSMVIGGSSGTGGSVGTGINASVAVYRVKTTYSESSIPFYVVDCVQAGTITRLNETDHITPSDFLFHITPGLANPSDPSLVSFESVSNPGSYLRIDSANLTSATRAVTTGAYTWDMNFAYDHLTWFDAFADTTAFKTDATFKKTASLNGDTTMVSMQWYSDSTRYLRHMNYHVFALLPATAQDNIDSSFTFEVQP
jgi:Alpha-L-arabinofuranosidase B (ABFB) domain